MDRIGEGLSFVFLLLTVMNISASPYPFLLVLAYAVHEAGHFVLARITGAGISGFKASLMRLCIKYDCTRISYLKEALVCGGGIIFNLVLFAIFAAPVFDFNEKIRLFAVYNLSLGLLNLYPVAVLDGGGILRCLANGLLREETAQKVINVASFLFAFLLWLMAVYLQLMFSSDISLLFISIFLMLQLCFSH